jgi:glycosyltransferase involved in cell wall biosynthesis
MLPPQRQTIRLMSASAASTAGVVVIGRNEGERLERCLASLSGSAGRLVYVDSGSSDTSVGMARAAGMEVLELDMRWPFTAARARNEGFHRLLQLQADLTYVFFVDGDCEVVQGWLEEAVRFLDSRPDVAVGWGRRRERHPQRSVYNLLCDIEWDSAPLGETRSCGGDAVMRVAAFLQAGGFRADLICGEEPELCARLRQVGWRIWHLSRDMTIHDAAIYRVGQWWTRMVRVGYGYAMFRRLDSVVSTEPQWVERSRQSWTWGVGLPAVTLALALTFGWPALCLLALYPAQIVRLALRGRRSPRENWSRAAALVLGKFPEMHGQLKFILDRRRRVRTGLIEYK